MLPIKARGVYIKKEASEDPRSMARIRRMLPFIRVEGVPRIVDDEALNALVAEAGLWGTPRHGRQADTVEPIVIFNQFLYQHAEPERQRRQAAFP